MRKLFPLVLLPLTACATVSANDPVVVGAGECRNDGLERFTGQPATGQAGAEMLRVSGARALQWIPEGTMVTMEYRADRLRVSLDANNRIERARCG